MKYLVVMEQKGEGCDYSIGCGVRYQTIEAGSDDEAIKKARDAWWGDEWERYRYVPYAKDNELCYMSVSRLVTELPIDDWLKEVNTAIAAEEEKEREEEERKQLAKLKEKYG